MTLAVPELSLAGHSWLVTGAAGGIGHAVARRLAAADAHVVRIDRPGVKLAPLGGSSQRACDLGDPEAVRGLAASLAAKDSAQGALPIGGLVHCAGITRDKVLWKLDDESWSEVLRANLDSAFYLLRELVPRMREHGGSIVLVASINGERGKFGQANYAASKAGLIGLARTAARELGAFGIRVNVIAPGLIRTRMTETLPADVLERAREESVLGRLGEPDDVARVAWFLCSDLSRHISGQVLRVDGGQLIG